MYNFSSDCLAPAVCEFLKFRFLSCCLFTFFNGLYSTRIIIQRHIHIHTLIANGNVNSGNDKFKLDC